MNVTVVQTGQNRLSFRINHPSAWPHEARNLRVISDHQNPVPTHREGLGPREMAIDADNVGIPDDEVGCFRRRCRPASREGQSNRAGASHRMENRARCHGSGTSLAWSEPDYKIGDRYPTTASGRAIDLPLPGGEGRGEGERSLIQAEVRGEGFLPAASPR
jgi:hypothetical protein